MEKSYLEILKKCSAKLSKNEAEFLLNLPKIIPEQGVIVEIGSYKGGSTCMLAKGSKINKKGRVYTIDPNISNLQSLKENIKNAGVEDRVTIITKTSEKAAKNWKKPISLLWIDGNHDYNFVKMDFLLWEKYLVNRGIIALHDTTNFPGPKKVVKKYILYSRKFNNIKKVGSITYAHKIKRINILGFLKKIFEHYELTIYLTIDRIIGQIGIVLNKISPKLYFKLKKLKEKKIVK